MESMLRHPGALRARRRGGSAADPSLALATSSTPPASRLSRRTYGTPAMGSTPNQRLEALATKTTPEALRDLEQTWREKRRIKLAAMKAGETGSNKPSKGLDVLGDSSHDLNAT